MTETSDVRLEGVEKRFGSLTALHSLNLSIPKGSLFSIIGPSGCGKTTTLRMIAGFERPSAGRIFIGGKDVTEVPAYQRNFGMVFQSYALFPHLSVADNVRFGLEMRKIKGKEATKKVDNAINLVGLQMLRDRFPKQLSGGQQQRVALARAIAYEPEVLLLDEPLGALDKMLRDLMQVEIRRLQQRLGITTIFVTHDQEEALTMSDQIAVMSAGRLQQVGSPREVYDNPRNEFVADFLGSSNIVDGVVKNAVGNKVLVECLGQQFEVQSSDHSVNAQLKISIRPEKIKFEPNGPLAGRIHNAMYRGASIYITAEIAGQKINVLVPGGIDLHQAGEGARINLRVLDRDLVILGAA